MYHSLRAWAKTPVSIELAFGTDAYGSPAWDPPFELLCYPEYKSRMIRNLAGDEEISTIHLYLEGVPMMPLHGKVLLNGQEYILKGFDAYYNTVNVPDCQVIHL